MTTGPAAPVVSARRRQVLAGGTLALARLGAAGAASSGGVVRHVGPQQRWRTLGDAVRAAGDGDTLLLHPGEYVGDVAVIEQPRLTIRGLGSDPAGGPTVVLRADGRDAEGKAILVVRGGDVRVEDIAFRGARVPAGNGAGIRFEAGRLAVRGCHFLDNEMGLLTANRPELELQIEHCRFGDAPRHDSGALHHLLYAGSIGRLTVANCRFGNGHRGHLLKSRARHSVIRDNLLVDAPGGEASYELEFPNGGHAVVVGNVVVQSARTDNPDIVSMGAEGSAGYGSSLLMAHNTVVNRAGPTAAFVRVWADRLRADVPARLVNNLFVGDGVLALAAGHDAGGNRHVSAAELRDAAGGDYRLAAGSPLRGRAVPVDVALRPRIGGDAGAAAARREWSPGALQSDD